MILSHLNQTARRLFAFSAVFISLLSILIFLLPLSAAFFIREEMPFNTYSSATALKIFQTAIFTIKQALLSTLLATAIGIPAAFFVARRIFWGRKFLISLSAVPLCIPALIIALGYISIFGNQGLINKALRQLLGTDTTFFDFLYSFKGIIITQGFYNFPIVMIAVADSWRKLSEEQSEAARLLGASETKVFFSITLYQLLPAVVSACIPVFLFCFFSFMLVLLFGPVGSTTLEVELYQAARNTMDFSLAQKLALTETILAILITTLYTFIESKSSRSKSEAGILKQPQPVKNILERFIAATLFVAIGLFFIAPLLGILVSAFPNFVIKDFVKFIKLKSFLPALRNTLSVAFLTAISSTIVAFTYSVLICSTTKRNNFRGNLQQLVLQILPLLPMSVSSVVMGFGITSIVRRGSVLMLIVAQTALFWPFVFKQVHTPMSKIPKDTMDCAKMLSPHFLDIVFRIYLPTARRGIISSIGFCFAISAGDTTLPLVLAIPRFDTLSLLTYRMAGSYRFSAACSGGLILALICALFFLIGNKFKE